METGLSSAGSQSGPPYLFALVIFPLLFALVGYLVMFDSTFKLFYPLAPFASGVATYAIAVRRAMSRRQAALWALVTMATTLALLVLATNFGVKTYSQTK